MILTKKQLLQRLDDELNREQLHNLVETYAPAYRQQSTKEGKKFFLIAMVVMVIIGISIIFINTLNK